MSRLVGVREQGMNWVEREYGGVVWCNIRAKPRDPVETWLVGQCL